MRAAVESRDKALAESEGQLKRVRKEMADQLFVLANAESNAEEARDMRNAVGGQGQQGGRGRRRVERAAAGRCSKTDCLWRLNRTPVLQQAPDSESKGARASSCTQPMHLRALWTLHRAAHPPLLSRAMQAMQLKDELNQVQTQAKSEIRRLSLELARWGPVGCAGGRAGGR